MTSKHISATTGWILLKFETKDYGLNQRVQKCQMKMTSNGRRPKIEDNSKYEKSNILTTTVWILLKLEN